MLDEPVPLHGTGYHPDPYRLYSRMRREGPVHRVAFPAVDAWLVTGYDAARATLTDRRIGKNHALGNDAWRAKASIMPEPQHSELQAHLLHQDGADHARMRSLVMDALSPAASELARPRIREIAGALVDDFPDSGQTDLVASFAARLPFLVLAETLGLPAELVDRFDRDWRLVVQPVGPDSPLRPVYEARLRALQRYIGDVVQDQRDHERPCLLGTLVRAHDRGVLRRAELDSMIFQLLVAGQEPVTNQLSTMFVALLQHPEALDALRADPGLLPSAVEELLRYDSALELTTWRFLPSTSDLHGRTVTGGDSIIVSLCAANRDEREFDRADELVLDRNPNPHLAFGHGKHYCPGAALARIEFQVALEVLLCRLESLSLACDPAELEWTPAVLARGVDRLPVLFERRA